MRKEAAAGTPAAVLARRYGVGFTSAERIVRGKTYRDVGGPKVERSSQAPQLTDEKVQQIRRRRAEGGGVAEIAREHGITRQMCDRIVRGKTYRDAPGPITERGGQPQKVPQITALAAGILNKRQGFFKVEGMQGLMRVSRNATEKRIERIVELGYARQSPRGKGFFELTDDGRQYVARLVKENSQKEGK